MKQSDFPVKFKNKDLAEILVAAYCKYKDWGNNQKALEVELLHTIIKDIEPETLMYLLSENELPF